MLVDQLHIAAQTRLRETVGVRVAGAFRDLPLERTPEVFDTYTRAISGVISGGQRASANLARAYMAAHAPPVEPANMSQALADVLVDADSDRAAAGLLRLWRLLDEEVNEAEARELAGTYAAGASADDLHSAERAGLDEGARVADREPRWRLEPNPGACEWCVFIAETGERYLAAETVPVPHGPDNPRHAGGVCNCSPAPEFEEESE